MRPERFQLKAKTCSLVICLLAFGLLVYHLDEPSLWGDEARTAEWVERLTQGDFRSLLDPSVPHWLSHPPFYFLCLWIWIAFTGVSEFTLRFLSVVFGMLCVAMLYPLGTKMASRRVALIAMGLMATSPFLVMYSRIARLYSLELLLTLISYWFFCQLLQGPNTLAKWVGYIVSSALAIYTEYLVAFVLAAQAVVALARIRRHRQLVLQFFASQMAVVLLFAPWIPVTMRLTAAVQSAPPAFPRTGLTHWLLSLVHPFFAWSVGETIYPWNPAGIVGTILVAWLVYRGLLSTMEMANHEAIEPIAPEETAKSEVTENQPVSPKLCLGSSWIPLGLAFPVFILLPLFLSVVTNRCILTEKSFLDVANKAIFCVPFIYLLVARGIWTITRSRWRLLVATVLGLVLGMSITNYYAGREFHNPTQALPTKAIAGVIGQQTEPGDIFVSAPTIGLDHYISNEVPEAPHFFADDPEAAKDYVEEHRTPRVWLILLCRAVETESPATMELVPWLLNEGYSLELTSQYAPVDEAYERVQGLMLRKPACEYKVVVYRYAL
jgi:4-amino-4-deoxy-L-arabinose transferase-like glycosyltransferase